MNALARILQRIPSARRVGVRWETPCPAHQGTGRNLRITQGQEAVLLKCWSHNCTPKEIANAIGLEEKDLFDRPLEVQQRYQRATPPSHLALIDESVDEIEREMQRGIQREIQRLLDEDARRLGYVPPLSTRNLNAARRAVSARYGVSLSPLPLSWWETWPHDEDPLWQFFAEAELATILQEHGRETATPADYLDALERAAARLREEAKRTRTGEPRISPRRAHA